MDVIPSLDVVHRSQFAKKPQVLLIIQSSPSSPVVDGLAPTLDEIHKSPSIKKTHTMTSADVGFLWRGFLKSRPSRSRGVPSPAVPHLSASQ
jgi:hypothetical protein